MDRDPGQSGPRQGVSSPGDDARAVCVDEAEGRSIKDLPREVGVMLVSVGVVGVVMPGMSGAPALVAGGLVLWPETFSKVEGWFQRRYPSIHRKGMKQIGRFLDDLERRFPDSTKG